MSNIASIGAAGVNAAGTIAVTKIAADTLHRTTRGIKKTPTKKVSKLPKAKRRMKLTKGKGLFN